VAIAEKALAELTDISSQVRAAVLFDGGGKVLASTLPAERAEGFAVAARLLWEQAEVVRGEDEAKLTQLEAATKNGSVFVVREAEQTLAAVTSAEPTAGLVFYDLRSALRAAAEKPKKRRAPAKKATPKTKPKAKPSGSP
jgi:predicted regulator of Ras-like GTPase activity (Roadblock/LC7/MglB family)